MSRTRRVLELATLAAMLCGLAGCPLFFPSLDVNPRALHFDVTDEIRSFRIGNAGVGVLTWEASVTNAAGEPISDMVYLNSRIDDSKQASSISGSLSDQQAIVEVRLPDENRPAFLEEEGVMVVITSNGGTAQVLLTASEPAGEAVFELSEEEFDFGVSLDSNTLTITNSGSVALTWNVDRLSLPAWLTMVADSGVVEEGQSQAVTLTVDRTGLIPGRFEETITFTSNAGPAEIVVIMMVADFSARPTPLNFGTIARPTTLVLDVISNMPPCVGCLPMTIEIADTENPQPGWLNVNQSTISLAPLAAIGVSVTADPTDLEPGVYETQLLLTRPDTDPLDSVDDSFVFTVEVDMIRSGIEVEPLLLDFGGLSSPATLTFVVRNLGTVEESYFLTLPTGTSQWLGVTALTPDDTPTTIGPGEVDTYTVAVNPLNVLMGTYEAEVIVNFTGGQEAVTVRMVSNRIPDLVVTPQNIDFASTRVQESIGIINGGSSGTINWSIDTSGFPAWLTLSPLSGLNEASGVLTGGNSAQSVSLEVVRSAIPPNVSSLTFSFDVVGTGDVSETETVNVTVTNTLLPDIEVVGDSISNAGIQEVSIPEDEDTDTFIIRNDGFGNLEWNIIGSVDPLNPSEIREIPEWIQGLSPSQDTLAPGLEQNVEIRLDRELMTRNELPYTTLLISTNDPRASTDPENPHIVRLTVVVAVPRLIIIGVNRDSLVFGNDAVLGELLVANLGDPGTMNYFMTCDKDWVNFFPTAGASEGTDLPEKDWRLHSISVDRSRIQESSDSAVITVYAKKGTTEEIDENVEPVRVLITVEVPQLTIETPPARLRVPSLVRHVMTLRNVQYDTIVLPENAMPRLLDGVRVSENTIPVEVTEDQKFMKRALPSRIRTNVLILLDYSNSMQTSASLVSDVSISGAPDPLQALYERSISALISELPDEFNVGLALFNERSVFVNSIRPVKTSIGEGPDTDGTVFIQNKAVLLQRLNEINVVDNGASELEAALGEATGLLHDEDSRAGLYFPFDDADVRALICVTDGRETASGSTSTASTSMLVNRIKFLPIGWGDAVRSESLLQYSFETGGHYYSCPTVPTGQVDALGNMIKIPSAATLEQWCTTDPTDECDQSLAKDLSSQVIFSYVSLNEESGVTIDVGLTFNDPTDIQDPQTLAGGCLIDQGVISNEVGYSGYTLASFAGDVNLGQISMSTEGIEIDGAGNEFAEIYVNLDAAPRNIGALGFDFSVTEFFSPDAPIFPETTNLLLEYELVLEADGGIIYNWLETDSSFPNLLFQTDDAPLLMGDFGKLFKITVTKANNAIPMPLAFRLKMDITEPTYVSGALDEKYFTAPDSILLLAGQGYKAPSFPLPSFTGFDPPLTKNNPFTIDLGSDIPSAEFSLVNGGGSHEPTGVWLNTIMSLTAESDLATLSSNGIFVTSTEATLVSTYDRDDMFVTPDRCQDSGEYQVEFVVNFNYASLGPVYALELNPIYVNYTILDPVVSVEPIAPEGTVLLLPTESTLDLTISNTGQGIFNWVIDSADFPSWLTASPSSGVIGSCAGATTSEVITLTVDRAQILEPEEYTFTIYTDTDTAPYTATIQVEPVPAP